MLWRAPAQPSPTTISSIRYSSVHVDDPAELGVQSEPRHLGAARLVGGDDAIGARALELLLGVLGGGPGNDRDVALAAPARSA